VGDAVNMETQGEHARVQDVIRKRILDGEWGAGFKIPSERDLESELGVSRMTISKGLAPLVAEGLLTRRQGSGTYVNDQSQLRRHRVQWVKMLCATSPNNLRASINHGVLEGAYDALGGYGIHVGVDFYQAMNDQVALLDRPYAPGEGGLLIWFEPLPGNVAALARLRKRGVPFVVLDAYPEDLDVDFAVSDNVAGGALMVQHLVELGHRRVGYLSRPVDRSSLRDRLTGFLQGAVTHQLPYSSDDVVVIRQPRELVLDEVPRVVDHFLALSPRPTAICFSNDELALTAAAYLQQKGIRIPEDVSLVGYDNVEQSKFGPVPLTSVQQDFYGMGKAAGKILGEQLNGAKSGPTSHLFLKPELIVRSSVARLSV